MRTVNSFEPAVPMRSRLSLKLLLLFLGAFVGVLFLIVGWTLLTAIGDNRAAAADTEIQSPVIVIDPKIQADLQKAIAFDAVPAATEVQNPFIDRASIGTNLTVSSPAASAPAGATTAATTNSAATPSARTTVTQVPSAAKGLMATETDNTKARWEDWAYRANRGQPVGPEAEMLGIDDLVPVGYAGGGDRGLEVIVVSLSLCRTFSLPVGTRLYNGVLSEITQYEVVFANPEGIRRKSYSSADPCQQRNGSGN